MNVSDLARESHRETSTCSWQANFLVSKALFFFQGVFIKEPYNRVRRLVFINFKGKQTSLFSAQNPLFVIWRHGRRGLRTALASQAGRRWFAQNTPVRNSRAGPATGVSQFRIQRSSFAILFTLLFFPSLKQSLYLLFPFLSFLMYILFLSWMLLMSSSPFSSLFFLITEISCNPGVAELPRKSGHEWGGQDGGVDKGLRCWGLCCFETEGKTYCSATRIPLQGRAHQTRGISSYAYVVGR